MHAIHFLPDISIHLPWLLYSQIKQDHRKIFNFLVVVKKYSLILGDIYELKHDPYFSFFGSFDIRYSKLLFQRLFNLLSFVMQYFKRNETFFVLSSMVVRFKIHKTIDNNDFFCYLKGWRLQKYFLFLSIF